MPNAGEGQVEEIQDSLDIIEKEVSKGNYNLKELGFWKIVSRVKRDSLLIKKYGDQIGRIDQKVFKEKALLPVNVKIGHMLETIGTFFGFVLIVHAYQNSGNNMGISFVVASLILMTTLHPLSHYIVGRLLGIEFTLYFLDGPAMIEPTLKTDYTSYLKASPKSRAIMHATGPIMTTLMPLAIGVLAYISSAPTWSYLVLFVLFILNIPNEIIPPILIKIGLKKILFVDFHKTDSYRALREWRIHKEKKSR